MKFILKYISVFIVLQLDVQVNFGECNTLEQSRWRNEKGRGVGDFVDFTEEPDQLAMESTTNDSTFGKKREILGKKKVISQDKGAALESVSGARDCPNVHKVIYPVIPVIIASLIGLIGAIIISWIARGIFSLMKENHEGDDLDSGYGRRTGMSRFLGIDWKKMDLLGMTKRVLTAIDKVY